MRLKDLYNLENKEFSELKEPSKAVNRAYLDGNRFLDTTKEYVYIEQGLINVSEVIHNQAHKCLELLDAFGDLLHERHLMQIYPETPELDYKNELSDLDSVFEFVIRVLDNIQSALEEFHKACDNIKFRPMALKIEELMLENSKDYTKILEMWQRWNEDGGNMTSFDNWCKRYSERE